MPDSRPLRIFLCHASQDKPAVRELYKRLKSEPWLDPWLDEERLLPGQDWDLEIYKAIREADAIIVCLSKESVAKEGYVQKEFKRALNLAEEKPEDTIYIIPLRLNDCQPPVKFQRYQWVDYFAAGAQEKLLKALRIRFDGLQPKPKNEAVKEWQIAGAGASLFETNQLTPQEWFEKGFEASDDLRINYYTEAVRLEPDNADVHVNLGIERAKMGDLDGALQDFKIAIHLKPDDAAAYYNKGLAHLHKGHIVSAIEDFTQSIRLDPNDANAYINRGSARSEKGDHNGALKDFNEAIRLKPDCASSYNKRGVERAYKNDIDGAIQDFTLAIKCMYENYENLAYINRGFARYLKNDFDGSIQDLTEAIRLMPDEPDTYYKRALAWMKKGETYTAMTDYESCLKYGGGSFKKAAENALHRIQKKLSN